MGWVAAKEADRIAAARESSEGPPHQPRNNFANCEANGHIFFIITKQQSFIHHDYASNKD
jgi:hypothetical protein